MKELLDTKKLDTEDSSWVSMNYHTELEEKGHRGRLRALASIAAQSRVFKRFLFS